MFNTIILNYRNEMSSSQNMHTCVTLTAIVFIFFKNVMVWLVKNSACYL